MHIRFKEVRTRRGITKEQLAKETGVSIQAIEYIEKGQITSIDALRLYANFFDVTSDYLIGLTNEEDLYSDGRKKVMEKLQLKFYVLTEEQYNGEQPYNTTDTEEVIDILDETYDLESYLTDAQVDWEKVAEGEYKVIDDYGNVLYYIES